MFCKCHYLHLIYYSLTSVSCFYPQYIYIYLDESVNFFHFIRITFGLLSLHFLTNVLLYVNIYFANDVHGCFCSHTSNYLSLVSRDTIPYSLFYKARLSVINPLFVVIRFDTLFSMDSYFRYSIIVWKMISSRILHKSFLLHIIFLFIVSVIVFPLNVNSQCVIFSIFILCIYQFDDSISEKKYFLIIFLVAYEPPIPGSL